MRLICPNCGAQYEVPDDVIPEAGRDVQCSNCGHTWFQMHPSQDAELAEDLDEPLPSADDADLIGAAPDPLGNVPVTDPWAEMETGPAPVNDAPEFIADTTTPALDYDDDYEAWEDEPATPPSPPRRGIDPDVAGLLREEAEFEARQRAAERGGLETQPDLGLEFSDETPSERRHREARERMARLRGDAPPPASGSATMAAAAAASRRDLLPDIDAINSTLRSTTDRPPATAADHETLEPHQGPLSQTRSGGFQRGFLFAVLIAVLALLVYIFAPKIAAMLPALAGPLDAYVGAVNDARISLDNALKGLMATLDSLSSETPADTPPTSGN